MKVLRVACSVAVVLALSSVTPPVAADPDQPFTVSVVRYAARVPDDGNAEDVEIRFRIVPSPGWKPAGGRHTVEIRDASDVFLPQHGIESRVQVHKFPRAIDIVTFVVPASSSSKIEAVLSFKLQDAAGKVRTFTYEKTVTKLGAAPPPRPKDHAEPWRSFNFRGVEWVPAGTAAPKQRKILVVSVPAADPTAGRERLRRLLAEQPDVEAIELSTPASPVAPDPAGKIAAGRGYSAVRAIQDALGADSGMIVLDLGRNVVYVDSVPPKGRGASVEDAVAKIFAPALAPTPVAAAPASPTPLPATPTPAVSTPAPAAAKATKKPPPSVLPKMTPVPSWVPRTVELPKGASPSAESRKVHSASETFSYSIQAPLEDVVAFHKRHIAAAGLTVKEESGPRDAWVSGFPASIYPYVSFSIARGNMPPGASPADAISNVNVTVVHHDGLLSPPGVPAPPAPPNLLVPLAPGAKIGKVVPGEGRMSVSYSTPRPFDEVVAFLERHPPFASAKKSGPTSNQEDLHTPAPYTARIVVYDSTGAAVGTPPLLAEVQARRDFVYVTMVWGIAAADGVERYKCSLGSLGSRVVALRRDGTVTVESGARGTFTLKAGNLVASLDGGEAWIAIRSRFGLSGHRKVAGKSSESIHCDWIDQSVPLPVPAATSTQAERLRKECDAGTAKSCTSLAFLYEKGTGGATQSISRAADLFERACDLRDGKGCNQLGLMTEKGLGGRVQSRAAAFRLYKKGCDLGHPKACYNEGSSYEDGSGVARSIDRALDAYDRGCELGDDESCDALDDLR